MSRSSVYSAFAALGSVLGWIVPEGTLPMLVIYALLTSIVFALLGSRYLWALDRE